MPEPVLLDKSGAIATVTMNRPEALNAISVEMIDAMDGAFAAAADDPDVRVVILTGSGRSFSVGADIAQLSKWDQKPELKRQFDERAPALFRRLADFPVPIIAAVNGLCVAGGFELCCLSDLVVAAEDAMIGDGHSRFVGFGPASAALASRLIPRKLATELLLLGELWTADRMMAAGFVNRVVPGARLGEVCREIGQQIAAKPPLALAAARKLMRRAGAEPFPQVMEAAFAEARRIFDSEDFAEGVAAFREKRSPQFRGR